MAPQSTRVSTPDASRTTPQPVHCEPGSMPMTVTPFPAPEGVEGTTTGGADWTDGAVLRGGMRRLRAEAGWVREG